MVIVRKLPCELNIFVHQRQHNVGRRFESSKMHLSHPQLIRLLSVQRRVVLLLVFTPIVGICYFSRFCYAILYVHSGFANRPDGEEGAGCFA